MRPTLSGSSAPSLAGRIKLVRNSAQICIAQFRSERMPGRLRCARRITMGPANPTHTVHLPAVPEPMVTSPIEGVPGVWKFTHEPGVNRARLSRGNGNKPDAPDQRPAHGRSSRPTAVLHPQHQPGCRLPGLSAHPRVLPRHRAIARRVSSGACSETLLTTGRPMSSMFLVGGRLCRQNRNHRLPLDDPALLV